MYRVVRKFLTDWRVGVIVVLFAAAVVLHYPQEILHTEVSSIFAFLGVTRHTFERVLLLLPVTYAALYSTRIGLAAAAAALVIMLPRVFLLSPSPVDALVESLTVILVAVLVTGWFHTRRQVALRSKNVEEILNRVIDGSPIPIFAIDKQHRVTHWNAAIELLSGKKRGELIGTDEQWKAFYLAKRPVMADLIVDGATPGEIESRYPSKQRKSRLIPGAYEAEDLFHELGKDGKWLRFTAAPITDAGGRIMGAMETLQDITEQKNAEESIRFYVREVTRAQEEERKRIACELHDETAQELVALSRRLERLGADSGLRSEWNGQLEDIRGRIDSILDGVRRFSQDLRPSVLDDLGLVPALEWLASDFSIHFGIAVDMKTLGSPRRLTPDVELVLFRIAQEALRNVCKHSGASKGWITVEFIETGTRLTVTDNGKGFEAPERVGDLAAFGKLGLAGMQQRAQLIGGGFSLQTQPGKGATITIEVP